MIEETGVDFAKLYSGFMEYDLTERFLYVLAAGFTVWFAFAFWLKLRGKVDRKHWFHEWGEAGFSAVWLALIIRALLVEAYSIPSESMVPTLLISDHLLVSKTTFGWPNPLGPGRLLKFRDVKRGEIVIFVPPHMPKLSYVKRCVGLPGDTIEVRNKLVYIDGVETEVPFSYGRLTALTPSSLNVLESQRQDFAARRVPEVEALRGSAGYNAAFYQTAWLGPFSLPAGTYYLEAAAAFVRPYARLLDSATAGVFETATKGDVEPVVTGQPNWTRDHGLGNRDWFGPYKLAPDEYWMMGDNRDNSLDSRYFGPVKAGALRGTPLLRYWPLSRAGFVH
jgi:signal peptidase I